MNIEHLLNYLLADAFGRVAISIQHLLDYETVEDEDPLTKHQREHLVGFCTILRGEPVVRQPAKPANFMEALGQFGAEGGEKLKEAWDAINREGDLDGGAEPGDGDEVDGDPESDIEQCDRPHEEGADPGGGTEPSGTTDEPDDREVADEGDEIRDPPRRRGTRDGEGEGSKS